MARKLLFKTPRWWITPSQTRPTVDNKAPSGISVSQEETASYSSSLPYSVSVLDDFSLPMWDNPVNATEYAVIKNASPFPGATRLQDPKAANCQLVRNVKTLLNPARPHSTPQNMLVICGEESTYDDDLTVNEMDFITDLSECPRPNRRHSSRSTPADDASLDFIAAKALQEEEIFRLALKRSLYDV